MNWYDVRIEVRVDGKPMVLKGAVRASHPVGAAYEILEREWSDFDCHWSAFSLDVVTFRVWSNGKRLEFKTEDLWFEGMVYLIVDPVRLAELDGRRGGTMNWYDVRIEGELDGKPLVLEGTVKAASEEHAAYEMLRREWPEIVEYVGKWGGCAPCYRFWPHPGSPSVFYADYHDIEDAATLITDPARLAELDSAACLPEED